jgi:hypothetical protein
MPEKAKKCVLGHICVSQKKEHNSSVEPLFGGDILMCPKTHFLVFSGLRVPMSSRYENDCLIHVFCAYPFGGKPPKAWQLLLWSVDLNQPTN